MSLAGTHSRALRSMGIRLGRERERGTGAHAVGASWIEQASPLERMEADRTYFVDAPTGNVFWLEDDALVSVPIQADQSALLATRAVVDFDRIEPDRAARSREIQAVLLERESQGRRAGLARELAAEKRREAYPETELSAFAFPDGAPLVREYLGR